MHEQLSELRVFMRFSKVRFTSKEHGSTASIVLSEEKQSNMPVSKISRLFPKAECLKMERIERGPYFDTWEEAFKHDINGDPLPIAGRLEPSRQEPAR